MRILWVAVLGLVAPALAGCISDIAPASVGAASSLGLADLEVPDGAELVEEGSAVVLRFAGVELPFEHEFTLPEGATIVRAVARVEDDVTVASYLYNSETGRRRCNPDYVDFWNAPVTGTHSCSAVAAIDRPGANWTLMASAPGVSVDGPTPLTPMTEARLGTVDLVFETAPLDGLAGQLDLSQLSMPDHELQDTTFGYVESFDGTPLWVEVTLPEGDGPWPTIIGASPYNGADNRGAGHTPAMWTYFTQDWAKRGYAIVNVDVRGFGMSQGCVEIWGSNEQQDQAFIVDWVAKQDWSDGKVGFYGQSYVATTPVEAAVQNPAALKAIIAVAPVINSYEDWHYGGVPNGESTGSPAAYQALTDQPTTPEGLQAHATNGLCDPSIAARANDPRAIYDAFYEERDFKLRAADIKAAVLFTQGFEDSNVKSAMVPGWFNEITAPKLGLFGHWVHQHPTRTDEEVLFVGWMDQYVKGLDLGFEALPNAEIVLDDATVRQTDVWPPVGVEPTAYELDLSGAFSSGGGRSDNVRFPDGVAFAGTQGVQVDLTFVGAGTGYLAAELYEGDDLVSYGMWNLAHDDDTHKTYTPRKAGDTLSVTIPFLPTEHRLEAGGELSVVVRLTQPISRSIYAIDPDMPAVITIDAAALVLTEVPLDAYAPAAQTARR